MINDLILRVTNNGVITDLDVDGNVPLRLDVSQVVNQEIGKVYGIASQNFNLPGTSKNNKFFNHAYLESAINIPGFYNTISCSVIRNGETLLQGQLQLVQVITNESGFTTYEVLITDSAVEFNAELGDKLLKDANFSRLDHTLTSGSIIESWTTPISGGVFYPVADYGADEFSTFPAEPIINLSGDIAKSGSIDNINTPMAVYQFLPAVKAKEVISSICQQAGFIYSSSFLDSSDFNNIYMLTKAKEDLGIVGEIQENTLQTNTSTNQFIGVNTPPTISIPFSSQSTVEYDNVISDEAGNYDNTTFKYTAPYDGAYFVDVEFEVDYDVPQMEATLGIELVGNEGTVAVSRRTIADGNPPYTGTFNLGLQDRVELIKGNEYEVQFDLDITNMSDPNDSVDLTIKSGSTFNIPRALSIYDDAPVNIALQFDSELKSIDVFKGILEHFNLVAYVAPEQNKVIAIEQLDDWIRSGGTQDWTEKYNTAKRRSINQTVDEQPKTLLFEQAEDADRFSKLSQESEPNFQYGTLRTISDSNIPTGETEIGKTFAPVVLASAIQYGGVNFSGVSTLNIGDSNFIMPHLYKFENNERVSFKFKPRLGYKVNTPVPPSAANQTIFVGNSGSATPYTGSYGTISNVNALPVVTGSTKDLHFNSTYPSYVPDSFNINSGDNNFTNNWQTYVNSLYWDEARKVTLDLFFEEYEYQDIKLNDKILIGDNSYRINKIKGFNLTRRDVVTVELLKDFPAYSPVINTGPFECPSVQTNPATNVLSSQFTANGEVISYGSDGVGSYVDTGFLLSFVNATDPVIGDTNTFEYWSGNTPAPGVNFSHVFAGLNNSTNYSYRAMISSSNELCDDVIYGDTGFTTTTTGSGVTCPAVTNSGGVPNGPYKFTLLATTTDLGTTGIVERGFVISATDTTPQIGEPGVIKYINATGGTANVLEGWSNVFTASVETWVDCNTLYYHRPYVSSSTCLEYGGIFSLSTDECPSTPTGSCLPFSASLPTIFNGACSETIAQVLYTDYSGSWPPTQAYLDTGAEMHVYTSAGCSVASPNTYYAFDSSSRTGTDVNSFLRVNDSVGDNPGNVSLINDCVGP